MAQGLEKQNLRLILKKTVTMLLDYPGSTLAVDFFPTAAKPQLVSFTTGTGVSSGYELLNHSCHV